MALENIYHPNVIKITTPYGASIDASLGGLISNWNVFPFTFILHGDIWFAATIWTSYASPTFRVLLRVKSDGRFCWYADAPTPNVVIWNGSYVNTNTYAPLLNGNVLFTQTPSDSKTLALPDYFVDGGWVYLPSREISIPEPCGRVGDITTLMLVANNVALFEFKQGFPLAYNLWAATGSFINGDFISNNGGFVGNFLNGVDPIFDNSDLSDIVGLKYGTGPSCVSYTPNGMHGKLIEFKDLSGSFDAFFKSEVISGALTCDGSGRPFPSAKINYFRILDRKSSEFSGTGFQIYDNGGTSACDIDGVYAICSQQNELELFDGINFVTINSSNGYLGSTGSQGLNDNKVVQVATQTSPKIWISDAIDLPLMGSPPSINSRVSQSLLNWHRPISTRGLYKT